MDSSVSLTLNCVTTAGGWGGLVCEGRVAALERRALWGLPRDEDAGSLLRLLGLTLSRADVPPARLAARSLRAPVP